MKKIDKQKIIEFIKRPKVYTIILILLTVIAISECMIRPGICRGADIDYHISRIEGIAECIKNGDIMAVTHPNVNGYGSGLFYPQVFLYIPAILIVIGLNSFTAYKIFLVLCSFVTACTMYLAIKRITKNNKVALIGAILYTTCPYRIGNLYWISALGNIEAFIFVPLVIWGMYEIVYGDYKKWYILACGILGLLYSHLISFVLVVLFVCLPITLFNIQKFFKDKRRIKYMVYAVLVVVLMSAFFVLPFFEQILNYEFTLNKLTTGIKLEKYIIKFPWNIIGTYNSSSRKETNQYHFIKMGVGSIIFVMSTIYMLIKNKPKKEYNKYLSLLYILATVYVFSIGIKHIWEHLDILNCIQFPWRLQLINSAVYCIIAAVTIDYLLKKVKEYNKMYIYMIITFTVIFNIVYNRFAVYTQRNIVYELRKQQNGSRNRIYSI